MVPSHYMSHSWPDSLTQICGTRGRWVYTGPRSGPKNTARYKWVQNIWISSCSYLLYVTKIHLPTVSLPADTRKSCRQDGKTTLPLTFPYFAICPTRSVLNCPQSHALPSWPPASLATAQPIRAQITNPFQVTVGRWVFPILKLSVWFSQFYYHLHLTHLGRVCIYASVN